MTASPPTSESITFVHVDRLRAGPGNLRGHDGVWPEPDPELAASVKAVGIIEPLIVRLVKAGEHQGQYEVIAGHRRTAAAILAGLQWVPALNRDLDDKASTELALIENLQREDLTALEEAEAYRRLTALGLGQIELSKRVGRSQAHVSKRLALLKLPAEARTALATGQLPLVDALELVPFAGEPAVVGGALEAYVLDLKRGFHPKMARLAADAKQTHDEQQARRTAIAGLEAAKVSLLKVDQYGRPAGHPTELGKGWGRIPMAPAAHKKHPCHAAYVDLRGDVHYVCTKPSIHAADPTKTIAKAAKEIAGRGGHEGSAGDSKRAAAAKRKAAQTRERNKLLRAAAPARAKKLAALLTARQSKAEVLDFTLRQLLQTVLDKARGPERIAAELLGVKTRDEDGDTRWKPYLAGGEDRLLRLAYAVALATGEHPFRQLAGRGYFDEEFSSHAGRLFAHLKKAGYRAAPVETAQLTPTNKYQWRQAFDK